MAAVAESVGQLGNADGSDEETFVDPISEQTDTAGHDAAVLAAVASVRASSGVSAVGSDGPPSSPSATSSHVLALSSDDDTSHVHTSAGRESLSPLGASISVEARSQPSLAAPSASSPISSTTQSSRITHAASGLASLHASHASPSPAEMHSRVETSTSGFLSAASDAASLPSNTAHAAVGEDARAGVHGVAPPPAHATHVRARSDPSSALSTLPASRTRRAGAGILPLKPVSAATVMLTVSPTPTSVVAGGAVTSSGGGVTVADFQGFISYAPPPEVAALPGTVTSATADTYAVGAHEAPDGNRLEGPRNTSSMARLARTLFGIGLRARAASVDAGQDQDSPQAADVAAVPEGAVATDVVNDAVAASAVDAVVPRPSALSRLRASAWETLSTALSLLGLRSPPLHLGMLRCKHHMKDVVELTELFINQRLAHMAVAVVRARAARSRAKARSRKHAAPAATRVTLPTASGASSASSVTGRTPTVSRAASRTAAALAALSSDLSHDPTSKAGASAGTRAASDDAGSVDGSGAESVGGSSGIERHASGRSIGSRSVASEASAHDAGPAAGGGRSSGSGSHPPRTGDNVSDTASDASASVTGSRVHGSPLQSAALAEPAGSGALATEAIWTMKFSCTGAYLGVAGGSDAGAVVRVWRVSAWDASSSAAPPHLVAAPRNGDAITLQGRPLLEAKPYREYVGHESHVVDIAWSRSNLLLSASMDGYVRLWHVSRRDCLHKFQHPDCVTSVCFHPAEDNFFITGCLDKKLRVWSLETGRVVLWQATSSMITTVAFSPDARFVVAGQYNGVVTFYLADGLRYHTQVECRNRSGRYKRGRKVTGIDFTPTSSHTLVSTNDSRLRLVSLHDFSIVYKYVGLRNSSMQIRASFSSAADRIISGSEDRRVLVWRTLNDQYTPAINPNISRVSRDRVRSHESFVAEDGLQLPPNKRGTAPARRGSGLCAPVAATVCAATPVDATTADASSPQAAPRPPLPPPPSRSSSASSSSHAGGSASAAAAGSPLPAMREQAEEDTDDGENEVRAELAAYAPPPTAGHVATTVAIFAPTPALALARPHAHALDWLPPHVASALASEPASSMRAARLRGILANHFIIVTGDSLGVVRIYENFAPRRVL